MGKRPEEFSFNGEEYFPLDDASVDSKPTNQKRLNIKPKSGDKATVEKVKSINKTLGQSKTYLKNVAKSVKGLSFHITKSFVPNLADFTESISETVKYAKDDIKAMTKNDNKETFDSYKQKAGEFTKDFFNEFKKDVSKTKENFKNGKFFDTEDNGGGFNFDDDNDEYDDDNIEDINFDDGDDNFDDGDDNFDDGDDNFDDDFDNDLTDENSSAVAKVKNKLKREKNNVKTKKEVKSSQNKIIAKISGDKIINNKNIVKISGAGNASLVKSNLVSNERVVNGLDTISDILLKTYEFESTKKMEIFNNVFSNISAKFDSILSFIDEYGVKNIEASMEYSTKTIAMQEDSLNLLKEIKGALVVENELEALNTIGEIYTGGASIDSEKYYNKIKENVSSFIENSPIGMMLGMGSSVGDMSEMYGGAGKTAYSMVKGGILEALPRMFLSKGVKTKLSVFNRLFENAPELLNSKLTSLARNGSNEAIRTIASLLGFDDGGSAIKLNRGLKDPTARAVFDKAFHRSVVEIIPGYLAKILAAVSGKEEIYYDMKNGEFKTASSNLERIKRDEEYIFSSNQDYNDMFNILKRDADKNKIAIDNNLKPADIEKDFEKIKKNIVISGEDFNPNLLIGSSTESKNYRNILSNGLKYPDVSLDLFADQFSKLSKGDQLLFMSGMVNVRGNRKRFYKNVINELNSSSYVPSVVLNYLKEKNNEESKIGYEASIRNLEKMDKNSLLYSTKRKEVLRKRQNLLKQRRGIVDGDSGIFQRIDSNSFGATLTRLSDENDVTDKELLENGISKNNTISGILYNIYSLLTDGIIVYPKNKMPEEVAKKISLHSKLKSLTVKELSGTDNQLLDEYEEINKERSEINKYDTMFKRNFETKSLLDILRGKVSDFKENNAFNKATNVGINKATDALYSIFYDKNTKHSDGDFDEVTKLIRK